jgi:hypothetical protein
MLLGLLSAKVVDEARDSILAFESDPVRMSLIDQIRELSPTVDSRFLSRFTAQELSGYSRTSARRACRGGGWRCGCVRAAFRLCAAAIAWPEPGPGGSC